jgi:S-formylglutathione hydrolase FrmB
MHRRGVAAALVAVAGALTTWVMPATPASADPPFEFPDSATIDVQGTPVQVDLDGSGTITGAETRMWDVTVVSPSIFVPGANPAPPAAVDPIHIPVKVRIYLPSGYDDGASGYDTLYLLHGGGGTYQDWSRPATSTTPSCPLVDGPGSGGGDIVGTLAGSPFTGITVMVEGGCSGWYSDWVGETDGHFAPEWETFHTQLVAWVDANLNTDATRSGRALAGLSMGGLGAMRYAARHTDLFSAVGSFSGAVEMRHEPFQDTVSNSMWVFGASVEPHGLTGDQASYYRMTTGEPAEEEETSRLEAVFGPSTPPMAPETRPGWPTMNPVELAASGDYAAYDGKLAIYSGESLSWFDEGEEDIAIMNNALHDALNADDVTHRYCRGFGKHQWKYWRNDLADFVQYVYGTTPSTCTVNGLDTTDTGDDWALVP